MSLKTKAAVAVAIAAVTAFILPSAALAAAPTTLPAGETLYAMTWTGTGEIVNLSPSGSETVVHAGNLTNVSPGGNLTYNAADGYAYWFKPAYPNTFLYKTNLQSGVSTLIAPVTLGGNNIFDCPMAINGNGVAYCVSEVNGTMGLYTLNLTTGALTFVASAEGLRNAMNSVNNVRVLAYNPVDSKIYVTRDHNGMLSTISTTGVVADIGVSNENWNTFAFDGAGTMWTLDNGANQGLNTNTPANWVNGSTQASTQVIATNTRGAAFFVAYVLPSAPVTPGSTPATPALANTGADSGADSGALLALGGLALLLVVVGAGVIALKRRNA